jgi:iron complex transport system ATP-binding protein
MNQTSRLEVTQTQAIEVNDLTFVLQNNTLLQQVNAHFTAGKIHAILGQNGAGKSTLLRCLTKEILPNAGAIEWQGQPLNSLAYAELALQRGVLSQSVELSFSFTVEQLVRLGIEVRGHCEQAQQVMAAVLKACDMQHLQSRDYLTLSGGEQQRAQLARVLAQIWPVDSQVAGAFNGKWLLLDEWTAGLDIKHQQQLGLCFKTWAQQGLGIIMVLHDIAFTGQLADHCLILKSGRVYSQGDVATCLTQSDLLAAMEINACVQIDPDSGRPFIYPVLESF